MINKHNRGHSLVVFLDWLFTPREKTYSANTHRMNSGLFANKYLFTAYRTLNYLKHVNTEWNDGGLCIIFKEYVSTCEDLGIMIETLYKLREEILKDPMLNIETTIMDRHLANLISITKRQIILLEQAEAPYPPLFSLLKYSHMQISNLHIQLA